MTGRSSTVWESAVTFGPAVHTVIRPVAKFEILKFITRHPPSYGLCPVTRPVMEFSSAMP